MDPNDEKRPRIKKSWGRRGTQGVDFYIGKDHPRFIEMKRSWTVLLQALDIWLKEGATGTKWTSGDIYWNLIRVSNQNGFEIDVTSVQALSRKIKSLYGTAIGIEMGLELDYRWNSRRGYMQLWYTFGRPFGKIPSDDYFYILFYGVEMNPTFDPKKGRWHK